MNYLGSFNETGIITGGSISYGNGNNKWGNIGVDLMYIIIRNQTKNQTIGINGFYERKILKKIILRGGVSYLKTGFDKSLGVVLGAGLSFPIGKMLIIQPMAELNFASKTNNIIGLNLNIGISL